MENMEVVSREMKVDKAAGSSNRDAEGSKKCATTLIDGIAYSDCLQ